MEHEPHDTFGTGLRAYLGRSSAEEASEPAHSPQDAAAQPPGPASAPADELAWRAQELDERERRLRERIGAFEAHVAQLARHEEALRAREAAVAAANAVAAAERRNVRETLREHAELSLARILEVFDHALTARDAAGGADHGVRLAAVRALLAEAYAKDGDEGATAAIVDELARMRERRTAT